MYLKINLKMALIEYNMSGVLMRRGVKDPDIYTEGRLCEDTGKR